MSYETNQYLRFAYTKVLRILGEDFKVHHPLPLGPLVEAYAREDPTFSVPFEQWLDTPDPEPAPLTVDDLCDEDRLGYTALVETQGEPFANDVYINQSPQSSEQTRNRYNRIAAAVIAEHRRLGAGASADGVRLDAAGEGRRAMRLSEKRLEYTRKRWSDIAQQIEDTGTNDGVFHVARYIRRCLGRVSPNSATITLTLFWPDEIALIDEAMSAIDERGDEGSGRS